MAQEKPLRAAVETLLTKYIDHLVHFDSTKFLDTRLDPIRFALNQAVLGEDGAVHHEVVHRLEMYLESIIGDFHEEYLGTCQHVPTRSQWELVDRGGIPGVDIKNEGLRVLLQVKSKYNSMNSSSAKRLKQELAEAAAAFPGYQVGCGWAIAPSGRTCTGEREMRDIGGLVLKGRDLYDFVTGTEGELDSVASAFADAIREGIDEIDFEHTIDVVVERVIVGLRELSKAPNSSIAKVVLDNAL